jgi:lipoprotein Spr
MSKNLLIGVASCFLILSACIPQPRYTSKSTDKKKGQVAVQEESGREQLAEPGQHGNKTKIDKKKMNKIIDSFLGAPYKHGGVGKAGIDCSGLVVQVYQQYAGFKLPRETKKLYQLVKRIGKDDLVYGDLVFFSDGWFSVSHVGIYLERGKFVHSAKESGVTISSLEEDYYEKRYRGARRVIP